MLRFTLWTAILVDCDRLTPYGSRCLWDLLRIGEVRCTSGRVIRHWRVDLLGRLRLSSGEMALGVSFMWIPSGKVVADHYSRGFADQDERASETVLG